MIHLENTTLAQGQQKESNLNERRGVSQQQNKKKILTQKLFHALYWAIIFFLMWVIFQLYLKQDSIQKQLIQISVNRTERLKRIQILLLQVQKQEQRIIKNEEQLQNQIKSSELKSKQMYKATMEEYHQKKIKYLKERSQQTWGIVKDQQKAKVSLLLAMNNYKYEHQNIHIKREIDELLRTQYERLSKTYNFSLPQKPFCIVVPTINNNQNFRNIYNLRSILNQNYSNFKVVILDDASTDQNLEAISLYLEENPVPQKVYLVKNEKRMGTVYNINNAAHNYCHSQDILLLVDGDDELLGINILKTFNSVYTIQDLEVAYSNLIVSTQSINQVKSGWSSAYSKDQKQKNVYRDASTRMFPVRTFKVSTFLKIQEKNLRNDAGQWFMSASDQVICPQVLQLSCGKNDYIHEFFYLYNFGLGSNDIEVDANYNYGMMHTVRRREKHWCPKK